MKKIAILTLLIGLYLTANAQMILEYDTRLAEGTKVYVPLNGEVDVTIDWGDGNEEAFTISGYKEHTYAEEGIYTVSISGTLTHFGYSNSGMLTNLVRVLSFGELGLNSLSQAFTEAKNLVEVPDQIPSTVTNISRMFYKATSFNDDISTWDVSHVTNMYGMFYYASSFNRDIGNWDVHNVQSMSSMFHSASSFNQDIGNWNVSNVMWMQNIFNGASSFNQDISAWDVSNALDMSRMFAEASSFNQDISAWDVSNVTNMEDMFYKAELFDQDLSSWDVSNVTNMEYMFSGAESFDQDLSG